MLRPQSDGPGHVYAQPPPNQCRILSGPVTPKTMTTFGLINLEQSFYRAD